MGALSPVHWIIIVAAIVLLFGGTKIPQLMRGLGQGVSEFKKGQEEGKKVSTDESAKPPTDEKKKDEVGSGTESK